MEYPDDDNNEPMFGAKHLLRILQDAGVGQETIRAIGIFACVAVYLAINLIDEILQNERSQNGPKTDVE